MAFKVDSMKKEKITNKTKDQILWEDFIAKNNIKKKFQATVKLNLTQITKVLSQQTTLFLIQMKS